MSETTGQRNAGRRRVGAPHQRNRERRPRSPPARRGSRVSPSRSNPSCWIRKATPSCTAYSSWATPAVSSVRVGKYLEVALAAASQQEAEAAVRQMCDRLLANPVIERYAYSVEPQVTQDGAVRHDEQ